MRSLGREYCFLFSFLFFYQLLRFSGSLPQTGLLNPCRIIIQVGTQHPNLPARGITILGQPSAKVVVVVVVVVVSEELPRDG